MVPFKSIKCHDHFAGQVVQSRLSVGSYQGQMLLRIYDNMFLDSDQMAVYLSARPSPALFALIKFSLGSHRLRFETDMWLPVKPLTGQCICRHCDMNADSVQNEQHFLFARPLYALSGTMQQHTALFGPDQDNIHVFLERNADQMPLVAHYIHLCCSRQDVR